MRPAPLLILSFWLIYFLLRRVLVGDLAVTSHAPEEPAVSVTQLAEPPAHFYHNMLVQGYT